MPLAIIKNKQGKEIYEGDIVCKKNRWLGFDDIWKIEFLNGGFYGKRISFKIHKDAHRIEIESIVNGEFKIGNYSMCHIGGKNTKIIGNVFENKELLKKK